MPDLPSERDELIRRYEGGPARLREALAKVPREALKWRPGEGKWSVHEVVCHCADSETNGAMRIRYLVAEPNPTIVGYDQARWAEALDYHTAPLEPALAAVEAVRANTAGLLRRLPEEAWTRRGRHTESGEYSQSTPNIWRSTPGRSSGTWRPGGRSRRIRTDGSSAARVSADRREVE